MQLFPLFQSNRELESRLRDARFNVEVMDRSDRSADITPPCDCPMDMYLRTAMTAIATGLSISKGDIDGAVFEGLAMLQDAELRIRKENQ